MEDLEPKIPLFASGAAFIGFSAIFSLALNGRYAILVSRWVQATSDTRKEKELLHKQGNLKDKERTRHEWLLAHHMSVARGAEQLTKTLRKAVFLNLLSFLCYITLCFAVLISFYEGGFIFLAVALMWLGVILDIGCIAFLFFDVWQALVTVETNDKAVNDIKAKVVSQQNE